MLPELAELGYDGVEIPLKAILFYGKEKFKSLLKQTGLKVIVMAMTDGPVCPGTGILWGRKLKKDLDSYVMSTQSESAGCYPRKLNC